MPLADESQDSGDPGGATSTAPKSGSLKERVVWGCTTGLTPGDGLYYCRVPTVMILWASVMDDFDTSYFRSLFPLALPGEQVQLFQPSRSNLPSSIPSQSSQVLCPSPDAHGSDSSPTKPTAVTISDEPEMISPSLTPSQTPLQAPHSPKQHRTSISSKRLTGRPSLNPSSTSLASLSSQVSNLKLDASNQDDVSGEASDNTDVLEKGKSHTNPSALLNQVYHWLQEEKGKRVGRKSKGSSASSKPTSVGEDVSPLETVKDALNARRHRGSDASDGGLALEKLEQILSGVAALGKDEFGAFVQKHRGSVSSRRGSLFKKVKRGSLGGSSDTDFADGDVLVPSADVWLDNTKTMAYGESGDDGEAEKGTKEHWMTFKQEIVRLTHTLRLKGWRRVPIERGGDIHVERLSGALTNAVYVVAPPKNLPEPIKSEDGQKEEQKIARPQKPPTKLLLRIYGAQVEHLIDRESELQILRRLARKRIGPRLLGTFNNGRFEQFFHARTLTAKDIRVPETSKQIAKRMRELHDGIDLLEKEREEGAFVWRNWDKWVQRCETVTMWLDEEISRWEADEQKPLKKSEEWKQRGFVCGVEWPLFRNTVDKYRIWLDAACGGKAAVREQLVFAHNDTQYGNLLRLEPSGESPLLHPANEHKQLVVIDFEYASANTPGIEFANHFTEWCYNYHSSNTSWACNTSLYPSIAEQTRFIRSYVNHRPQFAGAASSTPSLQAQRSPSIKAGQHSSTPGPSPSIRPGHSPSISEDKPHGPAPPFSNLSLGPPAGSLEAFTLDARGPPRSNTSESGYIPFSLTARNNDYEDEERKREECTNKEVEKLIRDARLWRVANSVQWVAWGIVQAKVKGMEDALEALAAKKQEAELMQKGKSTDDRATITESNGNKTTITMNSEPESQSRTHSHPHLQSDPFDAEDLGMAEDAANKRPEAGVSTEEEGMEEEEFDYLAYAQDRATFFWCDIITLGLVKEDELPERLAHAAAAKKIDY